MCRHFIAYARHEYPGAAHVNLIMLSFYSQIWRLQMQVLTLYQAKCFNSRCSPKYKTPVSGDAMHTRKGEGFMNMFVGPMMSINGSVDGEMVFNDTGHDCRHASRMENKEL